MKSKIVIFGNGSQAELAYYYFKNDSKYQISAFTIDGEFIKENKFCNLDLVAFEEVEKLFPNNEYGAFVAIGYKKLNKLRLDKYQKFKYKGYEIVSYISSKASVFANQIGENAFILEDNTIQPLVTVGNNVTIWSGNHIGHHSKIEDNCFITSHCVISGNCEIGKNSFIGVNSTIADRVKIGKDNIIGAGSLILKTTDDFSVYAPRQTELSKIPSNRIKL